MGKRKSSPSIETPPATTPTPTEDVEVVIVSTDKDLMQLVGPSVVLLDTMKDKRIGPAEVEERFGVTPAINATAAMMLAVTLVGVLVAYLVLRCTGGEREKGGLPGV